MHWSFTDETSSVTVNLAEDSSTGKVWGTVETGGITYSVHGLWEAENGGNISARKVSALHLAGRTPGEPGPADFIAVSGHIAGTAPSMTGIDLVVSVASGSSATLGQHTANLTQSVTAESPPATTPPSGGPPGTAWQFSSLDGKAMLDVLVGSDGVIAGNLTIDGKTFIGHG
ncbi:hypothetical protein HFP89_03155 [Wenzhouxiangella sp. XN79A]|uniref:hypothetical protein n=1 Tax=Wenzhouxiangella sp. XN79A TaxID=2724193 RepID=UPI00144ADF27|nr:hypothetical protein [Wenzhouxiangella sp. XN79A]NKI34163.1 hypothetical protein [Wenzhouxiangella sp. XN79A]